MASENCFGQDVYNWWRKGAAQRMAWVASRRFGYIGKMFTITFGKPNLKDCLLVLYKSSSFCKLTAMIPYNSYGSISPDKLPVILPVTKKELSGVSLSIFNSVESSTFTVPFSALTWDVVSFSAVQLGAGRWDRPGASKAGAEKEGKGSSGDNREKGGEREEASWERVRPTPEAAYV